MKEFFHKISFISFFILLTCLLFINNLSIFAKEELREFSEKESIQPDLKNLIIRTNTGKRLKFPATTKVLIAGDTMFNWMVREKIQAKGYSSPFEEWFPIFESADLKFLNLETPILSNEIEGTKEKSFVFFAEEADLKLLELLKLDGVFLGNNHAMDFEKEGLQNTIRLLESKSIQAFGAGLNENLAYEPRMFNAKNTNLLIYSISEVGPREHFARGNKAGVAYFYESKLGSLVKKSKSKNGQQISLLSLHWGWEYNPEPTIGQKRSAHKMIDAGFDLIIGHHPHVPQGIEIYKGKPILYSLGNFIFGSKNNYLNHNIVVMLHFKENKLAVMEIIPAFGKFQEKDYDYHPLDPRPADDFLKEYAVLCKKLGTNLVIRGGRGYVFLDKTMMRRE